VAGPGTGGTGRTRPGRDGRLLPTFAPGIPSGYTMGCSGFLPGMFAAAGRRWPSGRTVRPKEPASIIALAVYQATEAEATRT
jgi:hypothetical protein